MQQPSALTVLHLFAGVDGGHAEQVRVLSLGLVAAGHRAVVSAPPDAVVRADLEASGIPFVPSPIVESMVSPVTDAQALLGFVVAIHRVRPDVVHTHGQKAGILGRVAAWVTGTPVLYSPHGFVYRTQAFRKRRSGWARRRATMRLERLLARRGLLVACCEEERGQAIADRIVAPARVVRVYAGVRPDLTVRPDADLVRFAQGGPLVGFVAGLRVQKDLASLLTALEILAGRGAPVRFAIVGNGPLEAYVRRRISQPPLAATTMMVPFDGPAERYLLALDAFVNSSLWEGLPIAVLEAMACGVAVVATCVNGTPEALEDEHSGLLVPPQDAAALAEAIARLAADGELRNRLSRAGAQRVAEHFSVERSVAEMVGAYRSAQVVDGPVADERRGARHRFQMRS